MVKLWKLQLRVMERQRLLVNLSRCCQENLAFWRETEEKEGAGDWDRNCILLSKGRQSGQNLLRNIEKLVEDKDPEVTAVWEEIKQDLQDEVDEVEVMEFGDYFENLNKLSESAVKIVKSVLCSLQVVERPTGQDQEEAEALRYRDRG